MTEEATIEPTPAFETAEVQQALRTARSVRMSYEPVQTLITELKDMQARSRDFLVPFSNIRAAMVEKTKLQDDGVATSYNMVLRINDVPELGQVDLTLYEHVITQLAQLTKIGGKAGVPTQYLKRLLSDNSDRGLVALAAANVQELLSRRYGEEHTRGRKGEEKAVLIRTFRFDEGYKCRALLSDRYFPIKTLEMVTIALGLAGGSIGGDKVGDSAVQGAMIFDKHISVQKCSVGFCNPSYAFDLRDSNRGIIRAENVTRDDNNRFVYHYPGGATYTLGGNFRYPDNGPRQHLVFPACRISNSETGGGSAVIQPMLMEGACLNGMVFATTYNRTHIGSIMEETNEYESDETKKKKMETVVSMMTDAMRQVFSMESFEENCRKFLNLKDVHLKSDKVKEVTEELLSAIPGGEGLLDDVMKAYERFTDGIDTALDVQRAITNAAQDQKYDKQAALEEIGGALVGGEKVIAEKYLLQTSAPGAR